MNNNTLKEEKGRIFLITKGSLIVNIGNNITKDFLEEIYIDL